jgi:predicted amidophosphoribosyltransferase
MAGSEYTSREAEQKIRQGRRREQEDGVSRGECSPPPPEGAACPHCGAFVPAGALYCGECGGNLLHPAVCSACGAPTKPQGDICEVCGAWLSEGICKFCYTPLPAGAAFCPNCGNGRDGIVCPDCGTLSIFDFCPKCGRPLSNFARQALEAANNDPDIRLIADNSKRAAKIAAELAAIAEAEAEAEKKRAEEEAARIAAEKERAEEEKQRLNEAAENIRRIAAEKKRAREEAARIAAEKTRREEALRKQQEREAAEAALAALKAEALQRQQEDDPVTSALRAAINKVRNMTFANAQLARLFYMARRPLFSRRWRCNAYGNIHSSPCECAEPQHGGVWL